MLAIVGVRRGRGRPKSLGRDDWTRDMQLNEDMTLDKKIWSPKIKIEG